MKNDELKVTIIGFEDEKGFKELLAELQVEAVMKKVKSGLMLPREKMTLEAHAKEISKDMFND